MPISIITGATGFIGRRLSARCQEDGYRVVGLGRQSLDGPWDDFIAHDISGKALPPFGLADGVDTVFHLASKAHALSERIGETHEYEKTIVHGTERVVQAAEAAAVRSLVYLSSVKAMGEGVTGAQPAQPIDETFKNDPSTPYGKAKLRAEKLVLESKIPQVVVLRPVMVYGPGHKGNLVRMAEAIRRHRFPPVRANGNRRSMVHVDDLIEACLRAADCSEANREVITIAANRACSTKELYDQLRQELQLKPIHWHVPDKLLSSAAKLGDWLWKLTGKRMPLDTDTLIKLYGSAHYDNSKSRRLLGLTYANEKRPLLADE